MTKFLKFIAETRGGLALIWALYVLPRAALCLLPLEPSSDAIWYYTRADLLARGLGYLSYQGAPTAYWPVGYPFALSGAFRLLSSSMGSAALLNLLCGLATAGLALALGRRLFGSEAAARIGLLLLAIYPSNAAYFPLALAEVLQATLLLAACWLVLAKGPLWGTVLGGIAFGLATLVKTQSLTVIPFLFVVILLQGQDWRRRLSRTALRGVAVTCIALLTIMPWTLRNHQQLGAWVLVSTNGGYTLLTGNNDMAWGEFTPQDPVVRPFDDQGVNEVANDARARHLALDWITSHPARMLVLLPEKAARVWLLDGEIQAAYRGGYGGYARYAVLFQAMRVVNQLYYFALMSGFALAAIVLFRRRRREGQWRLGLWLLPCAMAAHVTLIAMIFSGQSRFHYPAMPFICMACGWLVADWWGRREARARRAA